MYNCTFEKEENVMAIMKGKSKIGEISFVIDNDNVYAEIIELAEVSSFDEYYKMMSKLSSDMKTLFNDEIKEKKVIWRSPSIIKELDLYARKIDEEYLEKENKTKLVNKR